MTFSWIGSGKGTQCEKIIEKYGFTHLSAGDLIRAAVQDSSTDKGRYFNDMMAQGKLISTVRNICHCSGHSNFHV